MNKDETEHLLKLLQLHQNRLSMLEVQAAKMGNQLSPMVRIEMDDIRHVINELEQKLFAEENAPKIANLSTDVSLGKSAKEITEVTNFRLFGIVIFSIKKTYTFYNKNNEK